MINPVKWLTQSCLLQLPNHWLLSITITSSSPLSFHLFFPLPSCFHHLHPSKSQFSLSNLLLIPLPHLSTLILLKPDLSFSLALCSISSSTTAPISPVGCWSTYFSLRIVDASHTPASDMLEECVCVWTRMYVCARAKGRDTRGVGCPSMMKHT